SGNGNGNITATFQANPTTETRIASITVSANGVTPQVVTLTQEGADPILTVSPESIQVGHEAGATNFNVSSNVNWTAQSSASWCSVTPSGSNNGSISVTYLENTNANIRSATITVNGTGVAPVQVTLLQEGTVGISATEGLTMNIMPIPAKDYLDIETAGFNEQMATLQIIDLTGHILANRSVIANGKMRFSLETLSGGIYFLRYSTNNQSITRRIVIVK
ncbi:MAG TPA: BACON domain-containing carbohydrate-binding protein, partial [Bacteroidales bacterium]|nr:BACON domain-containing carbohydrate-binding protein [Bacteroidales bacterium]